MTTAIRTCIWAVLARGAAAVRTRAACAAAIVLGALGASPATAAEVSAREVAASNFVDVALESDMPAYDLIWSDHTDQARRQAADLAAAEVIPGRLNVLKMIGVPARFSPLGRGEVNDMTGAPVDRMRIAREKAAYQEQVEEALLEIIGLVREARPDAMISLDGYSPERGRRSVKYGDLVEAVDFIFIDDDMEARLRRSDRRRPLAEQAATQALWLRDAGLNEDNFAIVRYAEGWIAVAMGEIPETVSGPAAAPEPVTAPVVDEQQDEAPAPQAQDDDEDDAPAQRAVSRSPDINNDGRVDSSDRAMLLGMWGTSNPAGDLNGDGTVNSSDLAILLGSMSPSSGIEGRWINAPEIYVRRSREVIRFEVTRNRPEGGDTVFTVWNYDTNQNILTHWDDTNPAAIPGHLFDHLTTGRVQVRAQIRDAADHVVTTFTHDMNYVLTAPTLPPPLPGEDDDEDENPPVNTPPAGAPEAPTPPQPIGPVGDIPLAMGVNLGGITYYSTEWTFKDLFKMSQVRPNGFPWDIPNGQPTPPLDAEGYPIGLPQGQAVSALMVRSVLGNYQPGEYVVMFEGDGELLVGFDARQTTYSHNGAGTARFTTMVTPTDRGIVLRIMRSNPSNHVRNIRFVHKDFEHNFESQPFHPVYLERLEPFRGGVLRFMNWCSVNNSTLRTWSERTKVDGRSQAGPRGVAPEYMIMLSNQTGIDPWFCMPHQADANYVRQFAMMVKQQLNPDIPRIYIEYSNEVWNSGFQQHAWVRDQGTAAGRSLYQEFTKRSVEMFRIWEDVFGDQKHRLVRVLGSHHNNPWVTQQIINAMESDADADVIAVAPYFGGVLGNHANWQATRSMTVEQVLDACEQDIATRHERTVETIRIAHEHGLPVIAYEGGQHLVGVGPGVNDQTLTDLFVAVNRHPRMYDLYMADLQGWASAGGKMYASFAYSGIPGKWGSWGLLEYQTQPTEQRSGERPAYKYRAIENISVQWGAQQAQENQAGQ